MGRNFFGRPEPSSGNDKCIWVQFWANQFARFGLVCAGPLFSLWKKDCTRLVSLFSTDAFIFGAISLLFFWLK